MNRRRARKAFLSEWLLEFSVLWAVFPVLDQLLRGRIEYWILVIALMLFVVSFFVGLALREDDPG